MQTETVTASRTAKVAHLTTSETGTYADYHGGGTWVATVCGMSLPIENAAATREATCKSCLR